MYYNNVHKSGYFVQCSQYIAQKLIDWNSNKLKVFIFPSDEADEF